MKRTVLGLASVSVLALGLSASAAPPAAPFTPDASTLLLMHFDNNLNDASASGYNGAFSTIATYTDPAFVAGQASYGQCLDGDGASTLNGVQLPNATGQIPVTPLTIEAWVYIPTPTPSSPGNLCVLDLAAGRLLFRLGYANGNPNLYPTFEIYNGSAAQYDQTDFTAADGWTFDAWHHVAATYNPSGTPRVKFFLDGTQKVNFASIDSEWQRTSFPGLTAGRVWPDPATSNLMPLFGKIDELRLSNVLRYGVSDVLLHMKLDGNYTDSSDYAWPTVLTSIGGFANPNFVAAPAPFGQAVESDGQGGLLNGVYITNPALSQTASPLTVEWRMKFPATAQDQEFSNTIIDLGAGRFLLTMRHAGNNYFHPQLSIYRGGNPEWTYCSIPPGSATLDVWHDFRMSYDPSLPSAQMVKFWFDGNSVAPEAGAPAVGGPFDKAAENPLLVGRVWPPNVPTSNLMPLNGTLDEVKVTSGTPAAPPDLATSVTAAQATITVDGNPADWAALASQAIPLDTGGRAQLTCSVKVAWDANYLYYLVQEGPGDTVQTEAANGVAYEGGPWSYDTVAFWQAFTPASLGEQTAQDFSPWFGFSSAARTDLMTARLNNQAALTQAPFLNASVATSGNIGANSRVIEARVKWTDLAATVDISRQPAGGLVAAITAGYQFGFAPLLIDNDWNGQSFIGGAQYTCPSGTDANSRNVVLITSPSGVSDWTLY